jgi:hypothetical protein
MGGKLRALFWNRGKALLSSKEGLSMEQRRGSFGGEVGSSDTVCTNFHLLDFWSGVGFGTPWNRWLFVLPYVFLIRR